MNKALLVSVVYIFFANYVMSQSILRLKSADQGVVDALITNNISYSVTFKSDSLTEITLDLREPALLNIKFSMDGNWSKRVWINTDEIRNLTIYSDLNSAILDAPSPWDILLDSLILLENRGEYALQKRLETDFIAGNPDAFAALWLFTHSHAIFLMPNSEKQALFALLDSTLQRHTLYNKTLSAIKPRRIPMIGEQFIEFTDIDINGRAFDSKTIRNKSAIVHFWSDNCYPCIRAMDTLVKEFGDLDTTQIAVISVCLDQDENQWRNSVHGRKIRWTSLHSKKEMYCDICLEYNLSAVPTFIFFDRNKKLKLIVEGDDMSLVRLGVTLISRDTR